MYVHSLIDIIHNSNTSLVVFSYVWMTLKIVCSLLPQLSCDCQSENMWLNNWNILQNFKFQLLIFLDIKHICFLNITLNHDISMEGNFSRTTIRNCLNPTIKLNLTILICCHLFNKTQPKKLELCYKQKPRYCFIFQLNLNMQLPQGGKTAIGKHTQTDISIPIYIRNFHTFII